MAQDGEIPSVPRVLNSFCPPRSIPRERTDWSGSQSCLLIIDYFVRCAEYLRLQPCGLPDPLKLWPDQHVIEHEISKPLVLFSLVLQVRVLQKNQRCQGFLEPC